MNQQQAFQFARRAFLAGCGGVVLCAAALWAAPREFFHAYLFFAFLFWMSISAGALGLLLLHSLAGGAWGETLRRGLGALNRTMLVMPLLFLPVALGLRSFIPGARNQTGARDFPKRAVFFGANVGLFRGIGRVSSCLRKMRGGFGKGGFPQRLGGGGIRSGGEFRRDRLGDVTRSRNGPPRSLGCFGSPGRC